MDAVSIALHTPLTSYANEFCDVLKLFYKVESFFVNSEDAENAEAVTHHFAEDHGMMTTSFAFRGMMHEQSAKLPQDIEPKRQDVIFKRHRKRLCKITLYELLKKMTGAKPPWGSLTGVRPTRLVYEEMAEGLGIDDAVSAAEAEFDISPDKAEILRQIIHVQSALPAPNAQEVDVYISIPFCRTRCAYCSFPGEAVGKGSQIAPYLAALFEEMKLTADLMREAGLKLRALYIGGGTPTALNEEDFQWLMDETMRLFPAACEYTVEAGRPDTITKRKLQTLKDFQVGRISINPQTMNDETLRLIGRDHSAADTIKAFEMARSMGFMDINMDVIAGLPGETTADFEHTMNQIIRLAPSSLTVHTLAMKRTSRLNVAHTPLPDGQIAAQMVRLGGETAQRLHMEPYYLYRQKYMAGQQQNVGYARRGCACLYNVDIMEENTSILAIGAGAISKRVFTDREQRIKRAPNVSNVSVYIDRTLEMARRKYSLFMSGGEQYANSSCVGSGNNE